MNKKLGIVADTHGRLREDLLAQLAGVDQILHAGDVGKPEVLEGLGQIAPVFAVRGNVDRGPEWKAIPELWTGEWNGLRILIYHILPELPSTIKACDWDVVIYGHSHKAEIRREDRTLFLNPGSCGPRRFKLPVTFMKLEIIEGIPVPELITLEV